MKSDKVEAVRIRGLRAGIQLKVLAGPARRTWQGLLKATRAILPSRTSNRH